VNFIISTCSEVAHLWT